MPSNEKQKAPISPINGPIVGTATAITTVKQNQINRHLLLNYQV